MNESIIPQKANTVNECRRLLPRGLRIMIATKRPLDDMPDTALEWLQRHDLIRPNKRAGEPGQSTWTYTATGRRLEGELVKEATRAA
ncbi:TPA: hypothetical protein NJV08_002193 [Corynebacterium striatum]|nr:hypothetical protein [Corynebacterium striatum]HCG2979445.1 hypothetical protein [Corynebacterium striatum]HCG2992827.1 hypothetical protein [Corynebacterium striatum]HCG2995481.1 hypothetical protein [Corynebacterium striatum]HCH2243546.1 hypothetical protein [Corynebacterium striatum]